MTGRMLATICGALALLMPVAAQAQFSDSYNFLKAVRDRDGAKVTELLGSGSTIVDTRDRSTGETGLHIVTKRRDATWLRFLLGRGAKHDVRDNDGNTPLMLAARLGFADGAQILLSSGANVNQANASGETPLIAAVQNRDMATVRVLLAAGADPNKADTLAGMSARDYAERDGRSRVILDMIDNAKEKPSGPVAGPK
jgi:ankyrin repeat protein